MQLNQQQFNDFCEEIENIGEHRVRADYSGRGMYGKECIGVESAYGSVEQDKVTLAILKALYPDRDELTWEEVMDLMETLPRPRHDSMGLGMIVYYPGLTIEEGVEVLDNDF